MAWFRAGGGGIPSSLKGDMNDVFNKKFGTVLQDYPPEDWPGTVNLMGPLPERTVSGSIVTFSDGADAVLLKSCEVTIAPNLDGVSSVDVVSAGKNLLLRGATSDTINGVTFTVNSDGSVTVNGTASANTAFVICNVYLKSGSYILSGAPATGQSTTYELQVLASNGTTYREYGSGRTFTLAQGTDGLNEVRILIRKNYVANNLVFYPQLELGSTASAYEPISGTTHTANLGRTIYGGEVDVVAGTGTDENGNDFTFTPVPILSRLGDNTMWGDGDLSVTYRRDIDLALAQ